MTAKFFKIITIFVAVEIKDRKLRVCNIIIKQKYRKKKNVNLK